MSNVSRSTYQKVVEKNRSLKRDIYILIKNRVPSSLEKIVVLAKWRERFAKAEAFNRELKIAAEKYIEANNEYLPDSITLKTKNHESKE